MKIFTISDSISHGWKITKKNFWFLAGVVLFIVIVSTGVNRFPPLSFLVGIFASISLITMALEMDAGKKFAVKDFFSKYNLVISYLVASVLYMLLVMAGLVLLIVPGIYWMIKYQFYKVLIIDKGMDPIPALKESARMTEGHKWHLLWFVLSMFGLNILGAIALGVGLFVSIPVTLFAYIYAYKKLLA